MGAEGDWPCLARGGEAILSDLDRTLSHFSVAGRVSLLGGPGVQLREGKDRPRPCSGVRGSPIAAFLGALSLTPTVEPAATPSVRTRRSCFCFHQEREHGSENFRLLTPLAKLILFNYLPGLSLNTFCVKFTVFLFLNEMDLISLLKSD